MPFWSYFLIAAAVCFALDRLFGLAHILSGFALVFLVFGVVGIFGIDLSQYDVVVELLSTLIFLPIALRLYFVLHDQRTAAQGSPGGDVSPPVARTDRNAEAAYKGLVVAGSILPLFVFNFITGGLMIVAAATLAGWVKPDGTLITLALVGSPFAANFVADARGIKGAWKYVWMGVGMFCGVLLAAFVTYAGIILHAR